MMDYMPPSAGRYLVKNGPEEDGDATLEESMLRQYIFEIIRKCGDEWCLYTKKKDRSTGRRRRLGTHSSRAGAERQERAIKSHGG